MANDHGGGASARIDTIAVDPTNADIVYVGSEGGLSKSTDGGANWSYLSDNFLSQSIRAIAIDPIAHNIIYVGTSRNEYFGVGIYRSFDSGITWTQLGATQFTKKRVVKIVIDPVTAGSQTSTTLYASVTKGAIDLAHCTGENCHHWIYKSTDSGSSWFSIRSVAGAPAVDAWTFYDIAIDPAAPSWLYFTAPDGVFKKDVISGTETSIHDPLPVNADPSCLTFAQSTLHLGYSDPNHLAVVQKSSDPGHTT
jgi:photosystem II stability/assembly factor-like uncharacterized protein